MEKPNLCTEPVILEGKRCWHIGKDPEGKEVYWHDKGYIKLKNGKTEQGKAIDEDGNFIKKGKEDGKES